MSNSHRGPSIDAFYQMSDHLANRFQRTKFLEIDQLETIIDWQSHLLMDRGEMSNRYRGPAIDASYQVSVHLAKLFQRRSCFRNRPIRNENCL